MCNTCISVLGDGDENGESRVSCRKRGFDRLFFASLQIL